MTGYKYESEICNKLKELGFWTLNIPKNNMGAQPFDIIAIKDERVLAIDCKVCEGNRFPLSRIEDNQWLSFELIRECCKNSSVGLFIYHNEKTYYLSYYKLCDMKKRNENSYKFCEGDVIF